MAAEAGTATNVNFFQSTWDTALEHPVKSLAGLLVSSVALRYGGSFVKRKVETAIFTPGQLQARNLARAQLQTQLQTAAKKLREEAARKQVAEKRRKRFGEELTARRMAFGLSPVQVPWARFTGQISNADEEELTGFQGRQDKISFKSARPKLREAFSQARTNFEKERGFWIEWETVQADNHQKSSGAHPMGAKLQQGELPQKSSGEKAAVEKAGDNAGEEREQGNKEATTAANNACTLASNLDRALLLEKARRRLLSRIIVITINSPGGSPHESFMIHEYIRELQRDFQKPLPLSTQLQLAHNMREKCRKALAQGTPGPLCLSGADDGVGGIAGGADAGPGGDGGSSWTKSIGKGLVGVAKQAKQAEESVSSSGSLAQDTLSWYEPFSGVLDIEENLYTADSSVSHINSVVGSAAPAPLVFCIAEDVAASGGYAILCAGTPGCVLADETSVVGSIGVVGGGVGVVDLMQKVGVEERIMKAGKNKVGINPILPVDPEAKKRQQAIMDNLHTSFKDLVKRGRGWVSESSVNDADNEKKRVLTTEDEARLFEADVFLGNEAAELGIIDAVHRGGWKAGIVEALNRDARLEKILQLEFAEEVKRLEEAETDLKLRPEERVDTHHFQLEKISLFEAPTGLLAQLMGSGQGRRQDKMEVGFDSAVATAASAAVHAAVEDVRSEAAWRRVCAGWETRSR